MAFDEALFMRRLQGLQDELERVVYTHMSESSHDDSGLDKGNVADILQDVMNDLMSDD